MSNFQDKLRITSTDVARAAYNQTHELGLVFDQHRDRTDAAELLRVIPDESLVFLEKCSYDQTKVDRGSILLDRRFKTPYGKAIGLLARMQHKSIALRSLYENNPSRYRRYKTFISSTVDEYEQTKGVSGQYPSFASELFFGLVEKGCLYTPGDANSVELPRKEALEALDMRTQARGIPEQPEEDPAVTYRKIQDVENYFNEIQLFRDYCLVNNILSLDEKKYRHILGYKSTDVLPTEVIRGRAHSNSVQFILNQAGINFKVLRDTTPNTSEGKVGTSINDDPAIKSVIQRQVLCHLKQRVTQCGPAIEVVRDALHLGDTRQDILDFLRQGIKSPETFASMEGVLRAAVAYYGLAALRHSILKDKE